VVNAISGFVAEPERWKQASLAAAAFARDNLAVDEVRSQIFQSLDEHCGAVLLLFKHSARVSSRAARLT
jgi:hypothetical protein